MASPIGKSQIGIFGQLVHFRWGRILAALKPWQYGFSLFVDSNCARPASWSAICALARAEDESGENLVSRVPCLSLSLSLRFAAQLASPQPMERSRRSPSLRCSMAWAFARLRAPTVEAGCAGCLGRRAQCFCLSKPGRINVALGITPGPNRRQKKADHRLGDQVILVIRPQFRLRTAAGALRRCFSPHCHQ